MSAAFPLLPVFLRLEGRECLVVGGGTIAWPKARLLLEAGARVEMIAPEFRPEFGPGTADDVPGLTLTRRAFRRDDLDGRYLVIAATDDRAVQREVRDAADARGILCNVVDVPQDCDFTFGATLRRGSLVVSISTEGTFPLIAQRLRDRWGERLSPRAGELIDRLSEARREIRQNGPATYPERRDALATLMSEAVLAALEEGDAETIERALEEWRASRG